MKKSEVYYEYHAEVCANFAHPKRLKIIDALRDDEMNVSELCKILGMGKSNLSQHLGLLRKKGFVKARREGTQVFYSISHPNILKSFDLISDFIMDSITISQKLLKESK
ncbi:MAG: ArsR/SmtB family transcription factor [Candidatus Aminicenantia bacterium]